jgi:hypothetical protein
VGNRFYKASPFLNRFLDVLAELLEGTSGQVRNSLSLGHGYPPLRRLSRHYRDACLSRASRTFPKLGPLAERTKTSDCALA